MIRFLAKVASHRLHYIARIAEYLHTAGLFEIRQSQVCSGNLGLLVGRVPEIFTDCPPIALESEYGYRCGTCGPTAIAETRSVADDSYFFHLDRRPPTTRHK